jgi:hypothetical protein
MNTSGIVFAQLISIPCVGEHTTINFYQHISPWCRYVYYDERSLLPRVMKTCAYLLYGCLSSILSPHC